MNIGKKSRSNKFNDFMPWEDSFYVFVYNLADGNWYFRNSIDDFGEI